MKKIITAFTTVLVLSSVFYVSSAKARDFCKHFIRCDLAWESPTRIPNGCYWYRDVWASDLEFIAFRPPIRRDYRVFIYKPGFDTCPTVVRGW